MYTVGNISKMSKNPYTSYKKTVTVSVWLYLLNTNVFEWGFYALSASKAIFRARTCNCITDSVR